MATNLQQIEELFHRAISVDPSERSGYLDRACQQNADLRQEVDSLIVAYENSSGALDESAVTLAMRVLNAEAVDSMVGQEVGPYRILSLLGRGGMGAVYLAENRRLNKKVALKFLSAEYVTDNWAKRQLIKEAQAVAMLDHPNICPVYDFEEIGEHSFIVMQYIEGETLTNLIRKKGVQPDQFIPLALQIANALNHAHAHGIIHRDIKPKNIMVTPFEQVKVLDFGLAKTNQKSLEDATESISQLSKDGLLVGTVAYMSPEQLRGEKLDYRSDIFSLGTVLYEMVCGKNPFAHKAKSKASKSNAEVISSIMAEQPLPLRQVSISCPRAFDHVIDKCLQKDRGDRYQSASELLIELENLQKGIAPPWRLSTYLNVRLAAVAAVLLLAAFVGVAMFTWASRGRTLALMPITCEAATTATPCMGPAITEGLVKILSRRNGLRVASSQKVPSLFGPNAASPYTVGRELDAEVVMFGRIGNSAEGPIVTIVVERVADGKRLLEKSYPLNPNRISTLQQRVSLETAFQLQLPTSEEDKALLELVAADDKRSPDAYRYYLQGTKDFSLRDGENIKSAIDNFRRATELDPSYAEAYAGIADCYVLLPTVAYGALALTTQEAMDKADWAAKQALKFGPNLAESHNAYGSVLFKGDWDWENAEKEFQKAIELNPDYQPAHLNYSSLLQITGRWPEAIRESELAVKLDPFSGAAVMNHCRAQYVARQFDQANACLDRLAVDRPDYAGGKYLHGIVYNALGRTAEATQIFEEIYARDKAFGGALLGYTYGIAGRRADAERILSDMLEYQKQHYLPDQEIGIVYLGMNDMDHAFSLLRKAVDEKFPPAQSFFFSPSFDRLRADPRFPELAKEARLPFVPPGSVSENTSAK
ncbi:MAG TPA: protein kinase [Pyrinomonadaceae bacterium]|nr:protein kinase [Pyrinomonadaceae bacterium]